jgi:uncharacterized protein
MSIHNFAQIPSLLKVGIFFGVWIGVWLPIAIPIALSLQWRPPNPPTPSQKLPLVGSLYLCAPPLLWSFAHLENQSFSVYGFNAPYSSILVSTGIGLVVGTVGLIGLFVIQQWLGWLTWQADWQKLSNVLLPTFLIGLWISFTEELVFRGFLLNQLQVASEIGWAAVFASTVFAILHLVWEGQAAVSQLPGLWLMGMVLVLARWLDDGNLGLAIGLHAGWIWGMASLDSAQMFSYTGKGSEWLTGLAGKPLAGVMGLLFLLVTGAILWGWGWVAVG